MASRMVEGHEWGQIGLSPPFQTMVKDLVDLA